MRLAAQASHQFETGVVVRAAVFHKTNVGDDSQEIEPGTLVFFPSGVPHQLCAVDGPLDYFEIQAWRSFKTNVLRLRYRYFI